MLKNLLESVVLFQNADEDLIALLTEVFTSVTVTAGEVLIRNGDAGDELYLVESGLLEVLLTDSGGQEQAVAEIGAGESIGEIAMLTGALRSATIRAKKESFLWQMTRQDFEQIAKTIPSLRASVEEAILGKIHRANLRSALYENQIFGKLDAEALQDLEAEIELIPLKASAQVIQQGQPSDSLYLIVSGQLRILVETEEALPKIHQDLGRGQSVGEIGLLTGNPRSASVYAVRDSLVGRLSEEAYYRLLQKHPKELTRLFSSQVMTELAQRSHASESSVSPVLASFVNPSTRGRANSFALVVLNADGQENTVEINALLDQFAERLVYHLTNPWAKQKNDISKLKAFYIGAGKTDMALDEAEIAHAPIGSASHIRLQNWFNEQEANHDYLIYGGISGNYCSTRADAGTGFDDQPSVWIERLLQQVDHVLYVAWADSDPKALKLPERSSHHSVVEASSPSHMLQPRRSLILLHPEERSMPKGTQAWLGAISVDTHHHVRWSVADGCERQDPIMNDLGRLARLITNNGIGLVLSGGAVRGFAQAGVIRALREAQVPIDLIGGASAGALSGAIMASGYSDQEFRNLIMETAQRKNMYDYTLPLTSFFAGKRYTNSCLSFSGCRQTQRCLFSFHCCANQAGRYRSRASSSVSPDDRAVGERTPPERDQHPW